MRGPCAKREVTCAIISGDLSQQFVGTNDCANPQAVCPRSPGEGYEKCQSICQQGDHAEIKAVKLAGAAAKDGMAQIHGHYYICESCGRALRDAGVIYVQVFLAK